MEEARNSIIINAFGGAGAGKTTACLEIVEKLKKRGYLAEYVQEYAKELVYEMNSSDKERADFAKRTMDGSLESQEVIYAEQKRRLDRLMGQVDFIVSDSPLLLSVAYCNNPTQEFETKILDAFNSYDSFNFVVERDRSKFEKEGRMQNLEESIEYDKKIQTMLDNYGLYYGVYNHKTIERIVDNCVRTHERISKEKEQTKMKSIERAKNLLNEILYLADNRNTEVEDATAKMQIEYFTTGLKTFFQYSEENIEKIKAIERIAKAKNLFNENGKKDIIELVNELAIAIEKNEYFYGYLIDTYNGGKIIPQPCLDAALKENEEISLKNCYLSDLSIIVKHGKITDFSGAYISNCIIEIKSAEKISFKGASINSTNIKDTNILNADFTDCGIYQTQIENCNLEKADFTFTRFKGGYIRDSNLKEANLLNAHIDGTWFAQNLTQDVSNLDTISITQGGATNEEVNRLKESIQKEFSQPQEEINKKKERWDNMEQNNAPKTTVRVELELPRMEYEELRKLENQLFEAGARYDKWEIPKEESRDGKAHYGKNWYVMKSDDTDMTPFKDFIKNKEQEKTPEQPKEQEEKKYERISLKLPTDLSKEEYKELSNKLYEAGARYNKNTVPAEKSADGKEHTYWNWHIDKTAETDMSPFLPYIKEGNSLGISAKPKENNDMANKNSKAKDSYSQNKNNKQPEKNHKNKENKKDAAAR